MGGNKNWVLRSDDGKCQKRGAILLARKNGDREGLDLASRLLFLLLCGWVFRLRKQLLPAESPLLPLYTLLNHGTLQSITYCSTSMPPVSAGFSFVRQMAWGAWGKQRQDIAHQTPTGSCYRHGTPPDPRPRLASSSGRPAPPCPPSRALLLRPAPASFRRSTSACSPAT